MKVHKIVVGPLATNCYILADDETKEAIIIDPGGEPEKILAVIKKEKLKPRYVLLTHRHFDHIGALEALKSELKIYEAKPRKGEGEVKIGNMVLKIIKTPGHTKDGICIINEKEGIIFSGDTLFKNGIGRTDLEGGDIGQIQMSLRRLLEYPDHFKVYPGHGEETTIGEERQGFVF